MVTQSMLNYLCALWQLKKSPMDGEMTERVKMLTTKLNGLS